MLFPNPKEGQHVGVKMRLSAVPVAHGGHRGVLRVTSDYVGSPASAVSAQRLADEYGALLPTRRMVDAIWAAADVKLEPAPIAGGTAMPAAQATARHQAMIDRQVAGRTGLIAGHKKDVVLTDKVAPGKVAIYGWHRPNGSPIQGLYLKHAAAYRDYSQAARLVHPVMTVDGAERLVGDVLMDPALAPLVSDEGPLTRIRYPGMPRVPQIHSLATDSTWIVGGIVALAVVVGGYWLLR